MVRILLADDHAVVRQGLKKILAEEFGEVVFGEAANGQEALDLASRERWDVLVLDLSLPVKCGLDVLKELGRRKPAPPVLVLSIFTEALYAVRAFKTGAAGYLTKQSAPEELAKAVRKVVAGGKYITPSLAEKLAAGLDPAFEKPRHEALTDREFQVLRLISSNRTLRDIARELSLSPKTVSTYRARLLKKMRMRTNAELTRYALQHGLIDAN